MGIQPQQPISCKPHFYQIETDVSLTSLSEVIADKPLVAILGGNESVDGWSIFAAEPVEVFEFSLHQDQPFEKLLTFLSRYQIADDFRGPSGIFCGGWIGFFGYELGRFIEALERSGENPKKEMVQQALKIAFPFTCFIIVLFGAPLANSKRRGGPALSIGLALATTIIFLTLIRVGEAMGAAGVIPPVIASI